MDEKVWLIYVGPSGQVDFDENGKTRELVAGRRYQMDAALAQYRAEHDIHHWKRPEPPKAAAVKE